MKHLFLSLVTAAALLGNASAQKQPVVTPVTGESWLSHLHRPLEQSSMGHTGRLGPATIVLGRLAAENASLQRLELDTTQSVTLQGADLYRLNCRACHGESGLGAPPEINSVIGATRATSASLVMARMKERGLDTSPGQANELASQAKATLLERLHKGGVDMPPFPHLSEPEIRAIFAYLRQLAEIPGAENQQVRVEEEEPVRVGEHIVKSTCHVCHSGVGVNPTPDELLQGAIPPLSSLTTRVSLSEFERKVRHGAPIMMGTPIEPYRGRMPVFDYLSEREVADAYLYLKLYPPAAWTDPVTPPNPVQSASAVAAIVSRPGPAHDGTRGQVAEANASMLLPTLAQILVGLLVVGGAAFTLYEVRRSKAPGRTWLDIWAHRIVSLQGTRGRIPIQSAPTSSNRPDNDAHKQAAWHSRFGHSEYQLFESSWLSRRWKKEDGAA